MTETTTNKLINYYELLFKFSEVIFTPAAEKYMTLVSKHKPRTFLDICPTMEHFRNLTEDEQLDVLDEIEDSRREGDTHKISFMINDELYEVRVSKMKVHVSKYLKEKEVPVFESEFLQKPSDDIDVLKTVINKISETYPHAFFENDNEPVYEEFYRNIIACMRDEPSSLYLSNDFYDLLINFKELFNEAEQDAISYLKDYPFISFSKFNTKIMKMFNEWAYFLTDKNHDKANRYIFNDWDNKAYIKVHNNLKMIVQESQNTIFTYILDTNTMNLKVWNCADVNELDKDSIQYVLKSMIDSDSYINAMEVINNPYSYYVYPFELKGITYPKSANYFLDNFNDNSMHLVYDSNKGFNISSKFSYCMVTDIEVLDNHLRLVG